MTTKFQREQDERIATMRQDADLRQQQQTSTLHQHAQAQADELSQGRFRATGTPNVIGATATPAYPPGAQWSAADQSVEPALGVSVNAPPEPVGEQFEIDRSIQQLGEAGFSSGQPDGGEVCSVVTSIPASDAPSPLTSTDDEPPEERN